MKRVDLIGGVGFVAEESDPPVDPDADIEQIAAKAEVERGAIDWAEAKHATEDADAEDAIVQSIIADLQGVKADIKAAPSGPLTLTRAQLLKIVRAVLWHIKGDKTA